ncbi:MAG: multidrug efflux SMR transporter [Bacteroidales bacterium]|nr:multidrug efflux SMR transporter [Bacteroidales bacterium]MDD2425197.1 multidrug efflux SMR transporter [Bacteroidales bacterium]MDD3989051.1 multidrug efflux SMR transporter [Bacteroidales bacterium]MDD4638142.1 multidrug efflux SMR transporter [Bacteroidales bacterium]
MNWITLIVAGVFETVFAFCLGKAKEAAGNDVYLWYGAFIIALTISMLLLIKATQSIPIGTAYAVWTGIGAAGTTIVGIFVFRDPVTFWRVFFLVTLILSVVGLKSFSGN